MRVRYQVFISSTYDDLKIERERVTWQVLKLRHIPVGMETFPAAPDRGWETIRRFIDTSDYYVIVLAGRYGSIDPESRRYRPVRAVSFESAPASACADDPSTGPAKRTTRSRRS